MVSLYKVEVRICQDFSCCPFPLLLIKKFEDKLCWSVALVPRLSLLTCLCRLPINDFKKLPLKPYQVLVQQSLWTVPTSASWVGWADNFYCSARCGRGLPAAGHVSPKGRHSHVRKRSPLPPPRLQGLGGEGWGWQGGYISVTSMVEPFVARKELPPPGATSASHEVACPWCRRHSTPAPTHSYHLAPDPWPLVTHLCAVRVTTHCRQGYG